MSWAGTTLGRGAVGQGEMEGREEARRRFELLAADASLKGGLELSRLPKDELGLRHWGQTTVGRSFGTKSSFCVGQIPCRFLRRFHREPSTRSNQHGNTEMLGIEWLIILRYP
jgi:hypothetical protein